MGQNTTAVISFTKFIDLLRDGAVTSQLTDELRELSAAIKETRKKGSITLKISIEPNGEDAVAIEADVKTSMPRASIGKAMMFMDQAGNMMRDHPRQTDIEEYIKPVGKEAAAGE